MRVFRMYRIAMRLFLPRQRASLTCLWVCRKSFVQIARVSALAQGSPLANASPYASSEFSPRRAATIAVSPRSKSKEPTQRVFLNARRAGFRVFPCDCG